MTIEKTTTLADHEPDSWGMCRICTTPDGKNGWPIDTDGPCPGAQALMLSATQDTVDAHLPVGTCLVIGHPANAVRWFRTDAGWVDPRGRAVPRDINFFDVIGHRAYRVLGEDGYELDEQQRGSAVDALHALRFETDRYLRSSGYTPCHPDCAHCAPKVQHFAEVRAGLQQRRDSVVAALTALGDGPCGCGMRGGEHWKGDHK